MKLSAIHEPAPIDPGNINQGTYTRPFVFFRGTLHLGDRQANHKDMELPPDCQYDAEDPQNAGVFGRIVGGTPNMVAIWPQDESDEELARAIDALVEQGVVNADDYLSYNTTVTPLKKYVKPALTDQDVEKLRALRAVHVGSDDYGRRLTDPERRRLRKMMGSRSKPNPTPGRKWWAPYSEGASR